MEMEEEGVGVQIAGIVETRSCTVSSERGSMAQYRGTIQRSSKTRQNQLHEAKVCRMQEMKIDA
jgi:hypothetical protein